MEFISNEAINSSFKILCLAAINMYIKYQCTYKVTYFIGDVIVQEEEVGKCHYKESHA